MMMPQKMFLVLTFGLFGLFSMDRAAAAKSEKLFVFFDDGCEHPATACQTKTNRPKKLKNLKKKLGPKDHYIGSVQTEFADKNEAGIDAYEHYFTDKNSCLREVKKQKCDSEG